MMVRPFGCLEAELVSIVLLLLLGVCLATEQQQQQQPPAPDYRRYLRTRQPSLVGERHVEEVLEVFRTVARPPAYQVSGHTDVNHLLALERFREEQRSRTRTTTTRTTPAVPEPATSSTYRTPTYENRNPDYRYLYRPLITATEIGATNITIKEADA